MSHLTRSIAMFTLLTLLALQVESASLPSRSLSMTPGQITTVTVDNIKGTLSIANAKPNVASATLDAATLTIQALTAGRTKIAVSDRSSKKQLKVKVAAPPMTVSPDSLSLTAGQSASVKVSYPKGKIRSSSSNTTVVRAKVSGSTVIVQGLAAGNATVSIRDAKTTRQVAVLVTAQPTPPAPPPVGSSNYSLIAWNDLGMHCMDGKDFSIFSILPPYNTLHAHLIDRTASTHKQITSGVTLTYESFMDAKGSINTSSADKTNFWDWVWPLYGANPKPNYGLNLNPGGPSNPTANPVPAPLSYNPTQGWWEAEGIPITPYDDQGNKNFYPMVQVVARDAGHNVLASTRVVLPVSDEMSCKSCHASASGYLAAQPTVGWVNDPDPEKDWKKNILRLHDQQHPDAITIANLATTYTRGSLLASADNGEPTLCAGCHKSNALATPAKPGIKPLTEALHGKHASVKDPIKHITLDDLSNRDSCYLCHPGSVTKCLRGVMGNNPNIDCQSCHGNLSQVGKPGREGWLEQPNCQSCHDQQPSSQAFVRYTSVFSSGTTPRQIQDTSGRFATNPNTPANGFSLYRFSKGHGSLQCESCHGSTHAIYPSSHDNDNLQSMELQGHSGTIAECDVCHANVPNTTSGGPHGLHTIGQYWVGESAHGKAAERNHGECTTCHGSDYRGSLLSKASMARTFRVENGTKVFPAGHQFGCYDCHNGPGGDD